MPDTNPAPAALTPQLSPQVTAALQQHIPILLAGVARKINIAQVLAAAGQIADIEVDKIVVGSARIGQLTLNGTSLNLRSGSAYLRNVRIVVELQLSLDWWFDIGVAHGHGTDDLGSTPPFGIDLGNVLVPSLNDIPLTIPNVTATDVAADFAPITNLDLTGGGFTGLNATNAMIPADGFQLAGLGVGSVSVGNVQVPRTLVEKVSIQDFRPNGDIVVPSVRLAPLQLPSANAGDIRTGAAIAFDGIASKQGLAANLGIFGVTIWVTPTAHINIGSMDLQGVSIEGSVNQATIQNVSVPVDIRGINLKMIDIGQIDVNSITL
jgi:hypothetical protein